MPTRMIPLNDGRQIPWLAFGTGTALLYKDATEGVRNAIAHGIVHLDGAQLYENEDSLGAGIAASGVPRETLFVTTKIADLPEGMTVRESFLGSLKRLRLDYVDLLLIHTPKRTLEGRIQEVWKEFEKFQQEGLAKSIGVSNFRIKDFEELLKVATVVPAVNQVSMSFKRRLPIVHLKGGPVDPVLKSIRERLEKDTGKTVTEGQVLGLWP